METKICLQCNIEKSISEFGVHNGYPDKKRPICKECHQTRLRTIHYSRIMSFNPPEKVICNVCGQEKLVENFPKSSDRSRGFRQPCKICLQEKRRNKRKVETSEEFFIRKNNKLKKKYNITIEDFQIMLKNQNNKCLICDSLLEIKDLNSNYPHVDHDHSTGKVRGILCMNCNLGLGYFNDSIKLLNKAIIYLQE